MPAKRTHKHRLAIKKSTIDTEKESVSAIVSIEIFGKGHQEWSDKFLPLGIIPEFVKIIRASKNEFTTIDISSIQKYIALETIDFSKNLISSLDSFQWASIQNIRELDLSRNQLSILPDGLGASLQRLEVLTVHHNQLTALPNSMECLKHLRSFDASYNMIQSVGDVLEELVYLDQLNLVHNSETIEQTMGPRTSRLYRKRALLSSKVERKVLIQRALCIRKNVLNREQEAIIQETSAAIDTGRPNPYP